MKIGSLVTAKHNVSFGFYYLTKDELHVEFDMINSGQDAALQRNDWYMWGKTIRKPIYTDVVYAVYDLRRARLTEHEHGSDIPFVVILDTKTGRELYCDQRDLVVVG